MAQGQQQPLRQASVWPLIQINKDMVGDLTLVKDLSNPKTRLHIIWCFSTTIIPQFSSIIILYHPGMTWWTTCRSSQLMGGTLIAFTLCKLRWLTAYYGDEKGFQDLWVVSLLSILQSYDRMCWRLNPEGQAVTEDAMKLPRASLKKLGQTAKLPSNINSNWEPTSSAQYFAKEESEELGSDRSCESEDKGQ